MNDINDSNNQQVRYSESVRQHHSAGKKMIFFAWCCILLIGYAFFSWHQRSGAYDTETRRVARGIEVHIPLTSGNRYEVFGKINNVNVKFLIDTGATVVAVSEKLAKEAGLIRGLAIDVHTAGGLKTAYLTKINTLTIQNDIILYNINATINPEMHEDTILLGMGALKQLHFLHTENTLILRQQAR